MRQPWPTLLVLSSTLLALPAILQGGAKDKTLDKEFRTSDRCVSCHNELKTSSGEDISIGFQWRASVMANSSRDPYWQGSVRRESMDHPESQAAVGGECSTCQMPGGHFSDRDRGRKTQVFAQLPLEKAPKGNRAAADGVSCSVCHQIEKDRLNTPAS